MSVVEECHGIFQFTDDLFEDIETKKTSYAPIDVNYEPPTYESFWFNTTENEVHMKYKYQVDALFYQKKYKEACKIVAEIIQIDEYKKREIYEAGLVCARECGDEELALRCLSFLQALNVEDFAIKAVLEFYENKS